MPENKQDKAKKLALLDSKPALVVFSELLNIQTSLGELKEALKSLEKDEIRVSNLDDINLDLQPLEANFQALNTTLQEVLEELRKEEPEKEETIDIKLEII